MRNVILYFGKMDCPFNNASACRVMGVCSALTSKGFECQVYGHSFSNEGSSIVDDIHYHNDKYPKNVIGYLKTFGSTKKIKNVLSNYDHKNIKAIFITSIGHRQLRILGKFCKKNKIPLIYDCGDINRYSKKNFVYKIISYFEFIIFHRYIKKYASVMAISSYIDSLFKNRCLHTFIVPCIFDPKSKRFDYPNDQSVDQNFINIGYLGLPQIKFKKDRLDWCIESFSALKSDNIRFYIAGVEKEIISPFVPDKQSNIIVKGKLTNDQCISLIKSLDFVVFFRENNEITKAGFPSKIAEAFACFVPIMTNNTSDIKQYLNENNSILVDGYSHSDCDNMFKELLNVDKTKINKMKKYLTTFNELSTDFWSSKILENIEFIEEKIKNDF